MGASTARRGVAGLALAVLAGCAPGADPSAEPAPDLAEIRLSGVRVGEQRTWRTEDAAGTRVVQVRDWSVRLRGDDLAWQTATDARVDVEGRLLDLSVTRDGIAAPGGPVGAYLLEEARPALLRALGGETVVLDAWLPASDRAVTATLTPAGPDAVAVETGLAKATWTLRDGRVRAEHAGAVDVVEVDAFAPQEPPDLPSLLRLPTEPWPDAAGSRHLVVRLDGVAPEDLDFPPWQIAGPDGVRVSRPLSYEIPTAAYEHLGALVASVRSTLAVAPRPGPPDALAVLATGSGDCNDYAAALVALLVADGVQARAVTGWVYLDAGVEPGLYPHAWVEALLEPAGWVPVDPLLGQTIADATHLRARDGVAVLARPAVTRVEIR